MTAQPTTPAEPVDVDAGAGVAGGVTYRPDGTRVLTAEEQEIADYYDQNRPQTPEEIAATEKTKREANLKQQQEAIDGINSMYNNLLAQIGEDNKSRIGSGAAINALSGQRGSASGSAASDAIAKKNQDIVAAKEAERNAKIAVIRSNYKKQIDDDLFKATEARKADADSWIAYKAGEIDRNKAFSADLRKQYITANLAPDEIDDEAYQEMAESGGYSLDQVKALYENEYNTRHDEFLRNEEERLAELDKTTAETEKIRSEAGAKDREQEELLIKEGYTYMTTPEQRDELRDKGNIMVTYDGRTYMAPTDLKTKVITREGNNILINSVTGEDIKDLGASRAPAGGPGASKNFTATTIPADVKKDLLFDKSEGRTIDELMNAYPEVSTSYLQSLFGINTFSFSLN